MEKKTIWTAAGAGALILFLSLWGIFGSGRAAAVVPEPATPPASPQAAAAPTAEAPARKYDGARYVRTRPLTDPFQAESSIPRPAGGAPQAGRPAPGEETPEPVDTGPALSGIIYGSRGGRALISWNGQNYTVKEGEQVGPWTVQYIQKKQVVLTGTAGERRLSLEKGSLF